MGFRISKFVVYYAVYRREVETVVIETKIIPAVETAATQTKSASAD
jgi:hypothetical protein